MARLSPTPDYRIAAFIACVAALGLAAPGRADDLSTLDPEEAIQVDCAIYGGVTQDKQAAHYALVTDKVNELLQASPNGFAVTDDALTGTRQTDLVPSLLIVYNYDQQGYFYNMPEGSGKVSLDALRLWARSHPEARLGEPIPPRHDDFHLIFAGYGVGDSFLNATARVSTLLHDQPTGFPLTDGDMGGDPHPGWTKSLVVVYDDAGGRHLYSIYNLSARLSMDAITAPPGTAPSAASAFGSSAPASSGPPFIGTWTNSDEGVTLLHFFPDGRWTEIWGKITQQGSWKADDATNVTVNDPDNAGNPVLQYHLNDAGHLIQKLGGLDFAPVPGSAPAASPALATMPKPDIKNGTILDYTFDEQIGDLVRDLSDKKNDGNATNVTWSNAGHRKGAASFVGDGSFITVPHTDALDPAQLTFSVWIQTTQQDSNIHPIVQQAGEGKGFSLSVRGRAFNGLAGTIDWNVAGVGSSASAGVADGAWHCLAGTFDGTHANLYVDGNLASTARSQTPAQLTATGDLVLGTAHSQFTNVKSFVGSLDDAVMYNRALSASEVLALYVSQGGTPAPASPQPSFGVSSSGLGQHFVGTWTSNINGLSTVTLSANGDWLETWQGQTHRGHWQPDNETAATVTDPDLADGHPVFHYHLNEAGHLIKDFGNLDYAPSASNSSLSSTATPAAPTIDKPPAPTVALTTDQARAVVLIKGSKAEGTGFLVKTAAGPAVVTNIHVISDNPDLKITTSTGVEIPVLSYKGATDRDLAMLMIKDGPYNYLDYATDVSGTVQTGDEVITPGNSEGGDVMLNTDGKILGIGPDRVEFDNPIYHGNSGGPVFHVKTGKVIGVVTEASKVDTSDELDKASFANRNSAIGNSMRYFGMRLDNVPKWESYDWRAFEAETAFLDAFDQRNECLDSYLNAPDDNKPEDIVWRKDDKIVRANTDYFDQTTGDVDASQKLDSLRQLYAILHDVADDKMETIQRLGNFYLFDQQRAKDAIAYRKALIKEFDSIESDISRMSSIPRSNSAN